MDRQDIDALLIGALYGELTPADEARLATHLESHPTDRGALDDLKVARQAVHDSRIFAVQLDPPQAVSALLLQEAHRRAPKRVVGSDAQEGWFARFARSFMAHPAMAAAAMLVLVMGGAGIVWMKKGDQLADKQYSQSASERVSLEQNMPQGQSAVASAPAGGEPGSAASAAGSAYSADLYEGQDQVKAQGSTNELALDGKSDATASQRWAGNAERAREEAKPKKKAAPSRGMAVTTDREPKDFDESKNDSGYARDDGDADKAAVAKKGKASTSTGTEITSSTAGMGGGGNANAVSGAGAGAARPSGGDLSGATYAQPPASAAPSAAPGNVAGPTTGSSGAAATTTPAPKTTTTTTKPTTTVEKKPAQKTVTKSPAPPPAPAPVPAPVKAEKPTDSVAASPAAPKPEPAPAKETKADSTLIAWAKSEHTRAVQLAKNGKCGDAAKVALSVSSKASAYYSQYMATDRSLKQCAQYINAERDKEAERSQKARASKRVNADEPAATK